MTDDERKIILARHERFETERLILRKVEISDADDIFEYASDSKVARYMTWDCHSSIEITRQLIAEYFISSNRLNTWGIVLKDSGKLIGTIDWRIIGDQAHFGWVLNRRYWGQGFMPEAASVLRNFAFEKLRLKLLIAQHDLENPKSGRVMAKIGMTKIGQNWVYTQKNGSSSLCDYWALTREEFDKEK